MKNKQPKLLSKWNNGSVAIVPGKFSNLYLIISSGGIVLVDSGVPSDVDKALDFLQDLTGHRSNIDYIVLSHLHLDHVAGVSLAASFTKALVAMSEKSKPYLVGTKIPMFQLKQCICELIPVWIKSGIPFPNLYDLRHACVTGLPYINNHIYPSPSIWLSNGNNLPNNNDWVVIETPGHTSDGISLFNEHQGILISGDIILNFYGKGEFSNIVGDKIALERSISIIKKLDINLLLPGHGEPIYGKDVVSGVSRRSQWELCSNLFNFSNDN